MTSITYPAGRTETLGRLGLVTLATAALVVGGCSDDSSDASPTTARAALPWEPIEEPATLPMLAIGDEPLWTGDKLDFAAWYDVQFHDTVAVVTGTRDPGTTDQGIAAVDANTGRTMWSVHAFGNLSGGRGAQLWQVGDATVVDDDDGGSVVVTYQSERCAATIRRCPAGEPTTDEWGVAALSMHDGSVKWMHAITPAVSEKSDRAGVLDDLAPPKLITIADDAAIVHGPIKTGTNAVDEAYATGIIAIDPATGTRLWDAPRTTADTVVGGTVIAARRANENDAGTTTAVALDVSTGKPRWELDVPPSHILAANSDAAVLDSGDPDAPLREVVALSDGSTIATFDELTPACIAGESMIACLTLTPDNTRHLTTYVGNDPEPRTSTREIDGRTPEMVLDDYVILSSSTSGRDTEVAVDRSANVLSEPLPGRVVTASDTHIAFDRAPSTKAMSDLIVYRRATG